MITPTLATMPYNPISLSLDTTSHSPELTQLGAINAMKWLFLFYLRLNRIQYFPTCVSLPYHTINYSLSKTFHYPRLTQIKAVILDWIIALNFDLCLIRDWKHCTKLLYYCDFALLDKINISLSKTFHYPRFHRLQDTFLSPTETCQHSVELSEPTNLLLWSKSLRRMWYPLCCQMLIYGKKVDIVHPNMLGYSYFSGVNRI